MERFLRNLRWFLINEWKNNGKVDKYLKFATSTSPFHSIFSSLSINFPCEIFFNLTESLISNTSFKQTKRKTSRKKNQFHYCYWFEWYKNKQRTADRAARAAGTIYRVAAGTESFDLDFNKQATRSTDDDTDFDHNNDDNDSTSRQLSAGNDNGVMQFPLILIFNLFFVCFSCFSYVFVLSLH